MKITSTQNKQVLAWNKLKQKKERDTKNLFLIEGDHLINEARKKGCILATIGLDSTCDFQVSQAVLKKISSQKSGTDKIAVCEKLQEKEINGNVIVLDGLQDPGNLGTIIRSAVAFNVDTIVLSLDTVDLYYDKVIRASEGMLFHINIIRRDLSIFLEELKQKKYTLYATTVDGNVSFKPAEKWVLIIGNEGNGISKKIQNLCDQKITIPMNKKCESLNAGVSASIFMYVMRK